MSPSLESYKVQSEKAFFNENYYTIQSKAASKFIIREKTQLNSTGLSTNTAGSIPSMQQNTTGTTATGPNQPTTMTTIFNNDVDSGLYSCLVKEEAAQQQQQQQQVIHKSQSSTNSTNTFKPAGSNKANNHLHHQVINIDLDQSQTATNENDENNINNLIIKSLEEDGCEKFFEDYFNVEALMNLKSLPVLDSPCLLHSAKLSLLNSTNQNNNQNANNNAVKNVFNLNSLNNLIFNGNQIINSNNQNDNGAYVNYAEYNVVKNVFKQQQPSGNQQTSGVNKTQQQNKDHNVKNINNQNKGKRLYIN